MQRRNYLSHRRRFNTGIRDRRVGINEKPKVSPTVLEEMDHRFQLTDWRALDTESRNDIKDAVTHLFAERQFPDVKSLIGEIRHVKTVIHCQEAKEANESGFMVYMRTIAGSKRFFSSSQRLADSFKASKTRAVAMAAVFAQA